MGAGQLSIVVLGTKVSVWVSVALAVVANEVVTRTVDVVLPVTWVVVVLEMSLKVVVDVDVAGAVLVIVVVGVAILRQRHAAEI